MADSYQKQPPYPQDYPTGIIPIHGGGPSSQPQQPKYGNATQQPPQIGFVNPSYPYPPPNQQFNPTVPIATPHQYPGGYIDPEDPMGPEVKGFDFSDESIRKGFIRKVYSILSMQLSITLGFIFWFGYHIPTRNWVSTHPSMFWVAFGLVIVLLLILACVEDARRKAPLNFIFLFLFTLGESYLVAMSTIRFSREDVLLAMGITTAVCVGLTIFAFQTKWDFTMMGGILFVCCLLLMLFGILTIFVHGKTMTLIYSSLGAILFSVYLIYDTQLMMGGKHKMSVSPEEYIFAALTLYLDIINIFIYILSIIGSSRD